MLILLKIEEKNRYFSINSRMIIKRDKYLNLLKDELHTPYIKVVTGPRRCGKSFLLNNIFYNELIKSGVSEDHIIRLSFDFLDDIIKVTGSERNLKPTMATLSKYLRSFYQKDKDMYYIIIDEIQELDKFYLLLNELVGVENVDVYVTGSNSKFLSSDVLTQFAGRGRNIRVYPLSFSEYYEHFKDKKSFSELLDEYAIYGGMPGVAIEKDNKRKKDILREIVNLIYLKDVKRRYQIRHFKILENIFEYLRYNPGALVSPSKIAKIISNQTNQKVKSSTVDHYLDYLEEAFLITRVYRQRSGKNRIISTPYKIFLEDLGLIKFAHQAEEMKGLTGHKLENLIFNELRYRGFDEINTVNVLVRAQNKDKKLIYKNLEVDFCAYKNESEGQYIQSVLSILDENTYKRETRPFKHIHDNKPKTVVFKDYKFLPQDSKGILFQSLEDFLLNPEWSK